MPVLTPLQAANNAVRAVMGPAIPFLVQAPLPNSTKAELQTRPIDAFLNLFRPVENFFAEVVTRATQRWVDSGGSVVERLPIGGTEIDLRVADVPGDNQLSIETRDLIRRLRIIAVFSAHVLRHPILLAQAFEETCVLRGMQNLRWMGNWIQARLTTWPAPPEGPMHRAWRALPTPARALAPEPPHLMGLGVVGADDLAALTIAANVISKCIEASSTIVVATITTAGTVTVALANAIRDIRLAELQVQQTQIQEQGKTDRVVATGRHEYEAPLQPGEPGYVPPSEGIPGWAIGLGVLGLVLAFRR